MLDGLARLSKMLDFLLETRDMRQRKDENDTRIIRWVRAAAAEGCFMTVIYS